LCVFQFATWHSRLQKYTFRHPLHFLKFWPAASAAPHPAHFSRIVQHIAFFLSRFTRFVRAARARAMCSGRRRLTISMEPHSIRRYNLNASHSQWIHNGRLRKLVFSGAESTSHWYISP
jgi:hypothetical protein